MSARNVSGIGLRGGRIYFRPISPDDAYRVAYWRNQPDARAAFYNSDVVTPDTHIQFCANRQPHDLVWAIETIAPTPPLISPIGMLSLTVDVREHIAEYGRLYIDRAAQGKRFALETEYLMLYTAFEWLRLRSLWLDAYVSNVPILSLHRKTGWMDSGIDLPGHTDRRGAVLHMTYSIDAWKQHRENYIAEFGVELGAWE